MANSRGATLTISDLRAVTKSLTSLKVKRRVSAFLREHPTFCSLLCLWVGITSILLPLTISDFIDQQIESPVAFRVREALGEGAQLSPRLKIFAFDDNTAAQFGMTSLPPSIWPRILKGLDRAGPRKIVVNVGFFMERAVSAQEQAEIDSIRALRTKIVAGGMLSSSLWPYRVPLTVDDFPASWHWSRPLTNARKISDGYLYGPEKPFRGVFSDLGHVTQPWSQAFAPVIFAREHIGMPHLGLLAAQSLEVKEGRLFVDGELLSVTSQGISPVNFISPHNIAPQIKSIAWLLKKIDADQVEEVVKPDDVVVLVGAYGSGFSDSLASPFGSIPGAFFSISIVNSTLQGQWLRQVDPSTALLLVLGLISAVIGWILPPRMYWIMTVVGIHVAFALLQLIFCKLGIKVAWLLPSISYLGGSILAYSAKRQWEGRRRLFLEIERRTASALQKDFLPPADETHPYFSIASYYQAAEAVGGDWYSYYLASDRWLYLHVGDVTGHGTPAALLASYAKGAIDTLHQTLANAPGEIPPLSTIHQGLNGILRRSGTDRLLLTMISVVIDIETGDTWCLNSAHQPGVILVLDEKRSRLFPASGSPILGFRDHLDHLDLKHEKLTGGEYIILFTDGLLPKVKKFLKTRHIQKIIEAIHSGHISNPNELRSYFINALRDGPSLPSHEQDDITLLIFKYTGRKISMAAA